MNHHLQAEVDQIARDGDAREQAEKLPQTPPNANSAAAASAATPSTDVVLLF